MADDRSTDTWILAGRQAPLRLPRPNTEDMAGLAVEVASLKDPIVGLSDRFSGHGLATLTGQVKGLDRDDGTGPNVGTARRPRPYPPAQEGRQQTPKSRSRAGRVHSGHSDRRSDGGRLTWENGDELGCCWNVAGNCLIDRLISA
jgi:hypothetical protein